jgi:hypothetical protein
MDFSKSPKILPLVLLGLSASVHAVTKTWVGGSNDWHLGSNWSPAGIPADGDDVIFDGTSQLACYLTAPTSIRSIQMTSAHTGTLDFQGSALIVTAGNADFRSGGSIVAGTGSVAFTGGGTQILYPKAGGTHPRILHDGAGTLQIAANTLNTLGFHQVNGVLDLTGASITTLSGGDLVIQNGGPSTVVGLGGRTLQIAGRTLLLGTSAGNLNLDPGSAWTLASAGSVHVDYATVGNCNASVSAGVAYRSMDAGSNSGWNFPGATTFYWHRNPFSTGAFNRSHNWTSGMDGSGFRPPGVGDDPFTSDALGGAWTFLDADADATTGSRSLVDRPDQLKLLGRGRGANSAYNEFVAVHRNDLAGNFDVAVRLVFQSPGTPLAEAGLLIADDPGALALGGYCVLGRSPDGALHFRRDMDGDGILEADIAASGLHGPVWLRLVKDGYMFSAYYRQTPAGGSWQQLGTGYTIASAATASIIGLYSTSGDAGKTAEAVFDDFQAGGDIDGAFELRLSGTGADADADAYLMTNTVAASVDFTGFAGIFNFSGSVLDVQQGDAVFSSTMTLSGASGTLRFSAAGGTQTFIPKSGSSLPDIQKAGSGTVVVSTNPVSAMGFTLAGGTWDWGSGAATHSLNSITATGGSLSFGSATVQVYGDADLSGLSTLTAGSGTLSFNGASAQTFTPKAGSTHPAIQVNGTGTVTVATNALNANSVKLITGGLDLATNALGLTVSGNVSLSGGILSLASATIGGDLTMTGGSLNAPPNSNTFSIAGGVSVTAGTYTANSGTLTLDGTGSSLPLNLSGATLHGLTLNGVGATWIAASNITAAGTVTLTSGTLDLSTNIATLSAGAYSQAGGTLSAASGAVDVDGDFTQTGGAFTAPGSARMFSVANNFVQTGGTFSPGDGKVTFDGAGSGNAINAATPLNAIEIAGSGAWTVSTNGLDAAYLGMTAGILNLGTLTHIVGNFSATSGGTLNFDSGTLRIGTGGADFSSLTSLDAGTGTLQFGASTGTQFLTPKSGSTHPHVVHDGAGALSISAYSLICLSFTQSAGSLDLNGRNITTVSGGGFTLTNGTSTTFLNHGGSTLTVAGDAALSGASVSDKLNLNPASAWTFAVTGTLSASFATLGNNSASPANGTCTNCVNAGSNTGWSYAVSWDGGGADNNWSTAANWGSDAVPSADEDVTFDGTSVKDATLDASATVKSVTFTTAFTGNFSFGAGTLTIASGNADFRSGGTITPGTGTLAFTSATAQTFYPPASAALPAILQNGAGGTTVSTHGLVAGNLALSSGTFNLGAGLTHSLAAVSGTGALDFGTSNLTATGNVDLSGLTVTATSGNTLTFGGTTAQTFTPNASVTVLNLAQSGAGGTTVSGYGFTTPALTVTNGTLALGSALAHTITTTLTLGAGGLDFGASTLRVGAATVDLRGLSSLAAGSGTLEFTGASAQTFHPRAASIHPAILQSGAGTTSVESNALQAGSLTLSAGVFDLGATPRIHALSSFASTGGALTFQGNTLQITTGDADFSGLAALNQGTGVVEFTAATGTQVFTPKASATHPGIAHSGAGTLRLAANALTARSFDQSAGFLDFNGMDVTVTPGGFAVSGGGAATLAGLAGRTLTVAGDANFAGTTGNLLNLDPASVWTLAVTGSLTASLASLANCAATVSAGTAANASDGGGNSGWSFSVTWTGAGADNYWGTAGNWGNGAVPGAAVAVVFDGTSVKDALLGAAASARSITFTTAYTGTFDFNGNTLSIQEGDADFRSGGTLLASGGGLSFLGSSAQGFIPKAGATFPSIVQGGTGVTTVQTNSLSAGDLTLSAGVFHLGAGLAHSVAAVSGSGGLDFSSSALSISGDADFSGLATLAAGTGSIHFTAASGTQIFVPKIGAVHPLIVHDAAGTVRLSVNDLEALGLAQTAGVLDLNGRNVTLSGNGSGDLIVTGGLSPFGNLGGRTLTVGGNARFAGAAGNKMALDPATAWTLAVSGTLTAANVSLRNSAATPGAGIADSSSDLGGNTGWSFLDTVKPDNVGDFVATATGGHAVALAWTAPAAQDADSVMLRYRIDGTYPAGPADGVLWRGVAASRTADTATGLADKAVYHFAAFVKDSSGNYSLASAGSRDTARTPDVTPPSPVSAMSATGLDSTRAALAWTASTSADADSVMIRYRTGLVHPAGSTDGSLWKMLPASATADTAAGLVPNTVYAFGLFVRDSTGNYSAAQAGTQDTTLYQRPVTGSIAINDSSGRTRDADPAVLFTATGADSLRFSLAADTAAAAWLPLKALDSLALGTDGVKILASQFKNAYGRLSAWYLDTTVLDRTAPIVALDLGTAHSRWNWPASLTGLSRDSHSGTDRVFVTRRRQSDGAWFDGSTWVQAPDTAKLVLSGVDSLFSAAMPASALATGGYRFTAQALDRAGNLSAAATYDVAYQDNRIPALASGNIPDTVEQNGDASWLLDFGDPDAGDSLSVVSVDAPSWLEPSPGPDTAWGAWPVHKTFRLEGRPLQAHVGNATVQVRLQDRGGSILTWSKALHVRDVNDAPAFADGQSAFAAREDSLTVWKPVFKDSDTADRHTLNLLQGPAFAKVEGNSVALAPGSRDVGDHPVRLVVGDGELSDTLEAVLTVANVNDAPYAFPSAGWRSPAFWREDKVDSFAVVVVDMDRDDDVRLATALPSYITVTRSKDTTGYNHTFRFTVKPTNKDTGAVNSGLIFRDAAGATSRLDLLGRIQADNDAPVASIEEGRTHAGAARFRLSVADEDGSLEETRFHYRLIGPSGDTLRRGIAPTPSLPIHPLADGAYRLAVKAEDKGGMRQEGYTVHDFDVAGATTLALDSGLWHMVGAPHASLPATAFGTGATLAGWDEAGDEGQPLARYATGQAVDNLRRGKGYWVRLKADATLEAERKDLLEGPFAMRLTRVKQGWNQIANPYPYWVDLSATRLTFWEWDAARRDLVNSRGLLKPWAAYWVLAPKDTTVTIPDSPWFPSASAPVAKRTSGSGSDPSAAPGVPGLAGRFGRDADEEVAFRGREDWTLRLALSAGGYHDASNLMGVRSASAAPTAGMERTLPDAPKFGEYVALHFERTSGAAEMTDQGFATDLRVALDPEEEWWDFSVENSGTGESRARIAPHGLEALASAGLRLFLVRRGVARSVEPGGSVALEMEGERSHYSLVVTPHADFAERLKGNFSISQNFPNPVTTFTTFRFFLPQSWDKEGKRTARNFKVRINLYDYSGRLAATAADGTFRPGSHILRWKPAARSGGPLAKGAYVYRLETAGFTKSLKLIVE